MSEHHSPSLRAYLLTFAALVVLLGAAILAAYLPLGRLHLTVTLMIAATKALLIMLIFMHLRFSNRLTWAFAGGAFLWLGIMIALTFSDYLSRDLLAIPSK